MTTVVVVDEAERQLQTINAWWDENRSAASGLVLEEFARCVALLEIAPDAGPRFPAYPRRGRPPTSDATDQAPRLLRA